MNTSDDDRAPFAKAVDWATRITSIALMMVLPGLLGYFVDQRLGTVILFTFLGFLFGMAGAGWQLVRFISATEDENQQHENQRHDTNRENPKDKT